MAEDPLHHEIVTHHDKVLIVDFGSQVTQLIARRVREAGVYCEIAPFQKAEAAFAELKPKAVILSGGPASVLEEGSPRAPQAIFEAGVPVLGICYGEQVMAAAARRRGGGRPSRANSAAPRSRSIAESPLFEGVWEQGRHYPVWMSHGDRVTATAAGLRASSATRRTRRSRVIADEARRFYGVQFHLEVVHTPDGAEAHLEFRPQGRRAQTRLDDGRLPRRGDRSDPRAGRRRAACSAASRAASIRRSPPC